MELRRPLENPSTQSSPFTWQSYPTSLAEFDAVCVIDLFKFEIIINFDCITLHPKFSEKALNRLDRTLISTIY